MPTYLGMCIDDTDGIYKNHKTDISEEEEQYYRSVYGFMKHRADTLILSNARNAIRIHLGPFVLKKFTELEFTPEERAIFMRIIFLHSRTIRFRGTLVFVLGTHQKS